MLNKIEGNVEVLFVKYEFDKIEKLESFIGDIYSRPHALAYNFKAPNTYVFTKADGSSALARKESDGKWKLVTGYFHDTPEDCLKRVLVNDIMTEFEFAWDRFGLKGPNLFITKKNDEVYLIDGEEVKEENVVSDLLEDYEVNHLVDLVLDTTTRKEMLEMRSGDSAYNAVRRSALFSQDTGTTTHVSVPGSGAEILLTEGKVILVDTEVNVISEITEEEAQQLLKEGYKKENARLLGINGEFVIPGKHLGHWGTGVTELRVKIEGDFILLQEDESDSTREYAPEMEQDFLYKVLSFVESLNR